MQSRQAGWSCVRGGGCALPDIYTELEISYFLLRRLLGVRTEGDKKGAKVWVGGGGGGGGGGGLPGLSPCLYCQRQTLR